VTLAEEAERYLQMLTDVPDRVEAER